MITKLIPKKRIKSLVYGGVDGIVTTYALITGIIGAGLPTTIILIIGLAHIIAEGLSMAAGDYLSTKSEQPKQTKKAIKNAITTKISFVTFGGIPLITYLTATYILPFQKLNLLLATITTILSLTILGIIKAKINKENPIKNTTELIIIGTIAALAAFIIGHTISTIIGTNLY